MKVKDREKYKNVKSAKADYVEGETRSWGTVH